MMTKVKRSNKWCVSDVRVLACCLKSRIFLNNTSSQFSPGAVTYLSFPVAALVDPPDPSSGKISIS